MIGFHFLLVFLLVKLWMVDCISTAPTSTPLASTWTSNYPSAVGCFRIGALTKTIFAVWKASCCSLSHFKIAFFFNKSYRGMTNEAKWFTNWRLKKMTPRKLRRYVSLIPGGLFLGEGKSTMAEILEGPGEIPSAVTWCRKHRIWLCAKAHFFTFRVNWAFLRAKNTLSNLSWCSLNILSETTTLSRYTKQTYNLRPDKTWLIVRWNEAGPLQRLKGRRVHS